VAIKLMKSGRLKDQAFVQFPTVAGAEAALERVQGLVLHGKPWVVVRRATHAHAGALTNAAVALTAESNSRRRAVASRTRPLRAAVLPRGPPPHRARRRRDARAGALYSSAAALYRIGRKWCTQCI